MVYYINLIVFDSVNRDKSTGDDDESVGEQYSEHCETNEHIVDEINDTNPHNRILKCKWVS